MVSTSTGEQVRLILFVKLTPEAEHSRADPAQNFSVATGNNATNLTAVPNLNGTVSISKAYNETEAAQVAVQVGNTTDVSLGNNTVSARFVQLTIQGSQMNDGMGATVAEFAVIGS